jgi:hypothetical protein
VGYALEGKTDANDAGIVTVVDPGGDQIQIVNPTETDIAWNEKGLRVLIGPTDKISNLPVFIDYDHHQLHEGETFHWDVVGTAGLAAGSSKDILFTVPNITIPANNTAVGLCPHFRFEVIADSYSQGFLYEAPTVTGAGTSRTPTRMERNGSYTPKMTIQEDPTISVVGTQIYQMLLVSGTNKAGSTATSAVEFVLKNNTSYLFRFTSQTNGCKYLLRFHWYEDLGV